jgi:hypothetical protein
MLVAGAAAAGAQEVPRVQPLSGPWDAGNGFSFEEKKKKTRRSLSGIACPANASGQRICLVVFDEGVEARYVILRKNGYTIDNERVVLRDESGELDAEAAATDGRFFYVTGSHSAKRKDCENNPDSRRVIRFKVNPSTGRALRQPAGNPKGALVDYEDSGRLWQIMASLPGLKEHVGDRKCLGTEPPEEAPELEGQRGVNIEGLAIKDGRLYFGFRGPAKGSTTKILSVEADALFAGGDPKAELTTIAVGKRRGIRDLHAVKDGFLLLAGPDDDAGEGVRWIIALWDGKAMGEQVVKPQPLARLDLSDVKLRGCDDELKPEALAVVEDTADHYGIVILSDGMCDGGPLAFKILR